jgi:acetylornithine deacetylase/succinyl-diaminopimelate desuccinylase-like protein
MGEGVVNWNELGEEAVGYLQEYIRIDTSNPPGNEAPGARFLQDILAAEDIACTTYEPQPGRTSLLARLEGNRPEKPLILLNHIDVVPAEPSDWDVPPFGGEIGDGYIWGRGALDMKGMGIMQLIALLAARREGIQLSRDVVFLAVADEEAGGVLGAKYLIDKEAKALDGAVVINEGGFINTSLVEGKPFFTITNAEKSAVWLKLVRHGQSGHGSVPAGPGALDLLVKALARLLDNPRPLKIEPIMREFMYRLSRYWEILGPYREDCEPETLESLIHEYQLMATPALAAVLHDMISLNVLNAGVKVNVVPDRAEAELDCRVLPGTDIDEFMDYVRESLDDPAIQISLGKEIEICGASPTDNQYYRAIEEVIEKDYPEAICSPFLLPGTSDSRFFRLIGVPSYGIIPAKLELEDISRIHGVNERIAVADLKEGIKFMYDLMIRICS